MYLGHKKGQNNFVPWFGRKAQLTKVAGVILLTEHCPVFVDDNVKVIPEFKEDNKSCGVIWPISRK